jgi:hypothetical protein
MASSPKEARSLGLKTYFTGLPCKRGGVAERRLNGDCLCEACLEFAKKSKAKWALKNKDKNIAWRESNPEKMALYKKAYAEKNKEIQRERLKQWKRNNKSKVLADTRKRQAKKIQAVPKWYGEFDAFVVKEANDLAKLREKTTGIKWHVDHMIPLQSETACGYHTAINLQVIPEALNCAKGNKMLFTEPHEWIRCA